MKHEQAMGWFLAITLLTAAAAMLYQLLGIARDARRLPAPGRRIDIGRGRRLHLQCAGAGSPAVVFEAGIAASSLSWTRVQPRVAAFTFACSYDRAGLAWSDASRRPLSARHLAEQLHALLTLAVVRPPYVLVGHSFGAFVVRAFANRHADLVAGMVLVDPIYPSEWLEMSAAQQWRLSGGVFLSRVGAMLARGGVVRACLALLARGATGVPRRVSRLFGSEAAEVLDRLVGEVQKLPPEVWPAVQAHWSQAKSFASMARHLVALQQSASEVAACDAPGDIPLVVITAGSQPGSCRAEHARIAALSQRGRHLIAGDAGHWIHLDDPNIVVEAIRDVVEEARAIRGSTPSTENVSIDIAD